MTAEEAIQAVTQYVIDTGKGAAEATRTLWPKLQPITAGSDDLMQFAIATRVTFQYRRPIVNGVEEPRRGGKVTIRQLKHGTHHYQVTVNLLRDVRYNINGTVKPVASFTRDDLATLAKNCEAFENGFKSYRKFWEETAARLKALKKDKVEDLAHAEQLKVAKRLHELQQHNRLGLGE
jgi:hypothetical protein